VAAGLLVVGTGLIGTSLGLALGGRDVLLADPDAAALEVAAGRGAGQVWDRGQPFRHCVVAAPPAAVAGVVAELAHAFPDATFSHVCSVQRSVQADLAERGIDLSRVCGSHPMAGKELSGPGAASARLFEGRPWVLCPSKDTGAAALAATRWVAEQCGAEAVELTAEEHDAAVALVSHLPQVASSAVAAVLARSTEQGTRLAGPGLQDTTRIAASDPAMWVEVLRQNAGAVGPLIRALADEVAAAATALDQLAARPDDTAALSTLDALLRRGNAGRRLVPRKRGEHDRDFVLVAVAVPDQPGQLAGVLVSAAQAGINVEDVRVEHLPGQPTGVIELLVHPSAQADARHALAAAGWEVVGA
jgi:prephenate dehydrogenase